MFNVLLAHGKRINRVTHVSVTGGSSPQPLSLLRPATLVQIQGSTFNTGNKYEYAKFNNLL